MELIYFFIVLGVLGTCAYIWARWFHKDENEQSQDTVLKTEK